jgi:hypothetical protein
VPVVVGVDEHGAGAVLVLVGVGEGPAPVPVLLRPVGDVRNEMRALSSPRRRGKDARRVGVCVRCGRLYHGYASSRLRFCSNACYLASLPPPHVRFWAKVRVAGPDECWLWSGGLARGYGKFRLGNPRRLVHAHRFAFFLTHGHWPRVARHSCDTPACCNPAHILDGTLADNAADMRARGRQRPGRPLGSANGRARLRDDDVRRVREMLGHGLSLSETARRIGVGVSAVWSIAQGRTWRHIP